jgi:hypothetical protein
MEKIKRYLDQFIRKFFLKNTNENIPTIKSVDNIPVRYIENKVW